jgi:hypothetical protein
VGQVIIARIALASDNPMRSAAIEEGFGIPNSGLQIPDAAVPETVPSEIAW